MRVLVFAPSFAPAVDAGGPARSLTNLATEAAVDHEVIVITTDRDLGSSSPYPGLSGRRVARGKATVYYADLHSTAHMTSLIGKLRGEAFDLILLNSIWHRTLAVLPATLLALGVLRGPVVLMPRGELEPGALVQGRNRKRLAGFAVRVIYRRAVFAVGTTSESEARTAAEWFPSAVILKTTNTPDQIEFGQPESSSGVLRAVAVGRVHPEKGLLNLLEGLTRARGQISLAAAGSLQISDYWDSCQAVVRRLPQNTSFHHLGSLPRNRITSALHDSDCMVLLTAGENYGHAIAESLQAGCPVITTPTTPWTDVIRGGGGEIVEDRDNPEEVAAVLDRWAAKTPEELAASRLQARAAFDTFTAQAGSNIIELALEALAARGG